MRRQIVSVLTYLAIVMLVTISVLYFKLNKVVPMFSSVFKQFGSELPKSTRIILKILNHSGTIFLLFFGLITILIITHSLMKSKEEYRNFTSKLVLKIPYFGNLIRKIYITFLSINEFINWFKNYLVSFIIFDIKNDRFLSNRTIY